MNENLKMYKDYLEELIRHLDKIKRDIESIQQRTVALDNDSTFLLVKLVNDGHAVNENIYTFKSHIRRIEDELSKDKA